MTSSLCGDVSVFHLEVRDSFGEVHVTIWIEDGKRYICQSNMLLPGSVQAACL